MAVLYAPPIKSLANLNISHYENSADIDGPNQACETDQPYYCSPITLQISSYIALSSVMAHNKDLLMRSHGPGIPLARVLIYRQLLLDLSQRHPQPSSQTVSPWLIISSPCTP